MALSIGTKLGAYEIVQAIGAGGFGQVYKARDTRLNRFVAIKVFTEHLSQNAELKARFEREARTLASLSHPHICPIFDAGQQDGTDYLVMEFLEGQTLAQRLEKGALPLDEALRIAIEIADALDKAHRQGVTHRDLKPGNIILTKTGSKLLDFGLAKLAPRPVATQEPFSEQPTAKGDSVLTAEGTILGTLQYMSPEQLEGEEADARSDIFAFGAVLYEMITGERAFEGKSKASLIAAIIGSEPRPISSIQPVAPPALDRLVSMCIAKDPNDRWQTAHNVATDLKWIIQGSAAKPGPEPVAVAPSKLRQRFAMALIVVLAITTLVFAGILGYGYLIPTNEAAIRFNVQIPENTAVTGQADAPFPAVSPDGRYLAFVTLSQGRPVLQLQALDSLAAQTLPGTEDAIRPFWSPDSRFIGFFAGGKLKKVSLAGGLPSVLCDAPTNVDSVSGAWNKDGVIIFGATSSEFGSLYAVSAASGRPTLLVSADKSRLESLGFPYFLPDGRRFLYLSRTPQPSQSGIYLGSLDSTERKQVLVANSRIVYSPPGYLLFAQSGQLMAQQFDVGRGETTGDALLIGDQILQSISGAVAFSVSNNGILAFSERGGVTTTQLTWYDRNGKQLGTITAPGANSVPALSPDGQRLGVSRADGENRRGNQQISDIWLIDLSRGTNSRLTFDGGGSFAWSPDGKTIVFQKPNKGLYQKAANGIGNEEMLLPGDFFPGDWSRDGRFIVFRRDNNGMDVWGLPTFGDRKPFPILETKFNENVARLSPDAHWMAYTSDESGKPELYVQSFPPSGSKWQVSLEGANFAAWRRDGKELIFLTPERKIMALDVKLGPTFEAGVPRFLFEIPSPLIQAGIRFVVSPDGQQFLFPFPAETTSGPPITVLTNWTSTIKK